MSTATQNSTGGSGGLKTVGFTIGVAILVLVSLYVAKCCNDNPSIQTIFFRNNNSSSRGDHHPPEFTLERHTQSIGDKPIISDVWIASWYPVCSQPDSQFKTPGVAQTQGDGQVRDQDPTTNRQGRLFWTGLLPLSVENVSSADTAISSQPKVGDSGNLTSSTKIQISTIILMPFRPPISLPSTSSPKSPPGGIYDPSREYALGMSSFTSYAPGD